MDKLEEYLKDLEGQFQNALRQVHMIDGAMQTVRFLIEEKKKVAEDGKIQAVSEEA